MSIEVVTIGAATLYNGDCKEILSSLDKVDAAVTDPPYGISVDRAMAAKSGKQYGQMAAKSTFYESSGWDDAAPEQSLLDLIRNKSKHQIIFGGNYFNLPPTTCWLVWDKQNGMNEFADCELAWTNLDKPVRRIYWRWNGMIRKGHEERMHPTQKPEGVMLWCLDQLPKDVQTICDPFMGSGTTGVACLRRGKIFIGIERDRKYFDEACRRLEKLQSQGNLLSDMMDDPQYREMMRTHYKKEKLEPTVDLIALADPSKEKPVKLVKPTKEKIAKVTKLNSRPLISIGESTPTRPADSPGREIARSVHIPFTDPFVEANRVLLATTERPTFDEATWDWDSSSPVGCDVECFENFFLVAFRRFSDKKRITFELSERCDLDKVNLDLVMQRNQIITFNGNTYDVPMIYYAMKKSVNCSHLKSASNRIIKTGIKPWDIERELGIRIPKLDHIDLLEPNPSIKQSLKMLNGRLHGRYVVDLPYPEDARLTPQQMNFCTHYCFNDLDGTELLWNAMKEPLELRVALGKEYGIDLRSKSDAQVGEAIVKKRVESALGRKLARGDSSSSFHYTVPDFISFEDERLNAVLRDLKNTEFRVDGSGKVESPEWLKKLEVRIGASTYSCGIGGLHSAEEHRSVHGDTEHLLIDIDATGYYPNAIMKLGLYPKAFGPAFLDIYGKIIKERTAAKAAGDKIKADGLKISSNGIFGKLGSIYSPLYAPHLLIATTLTGQLAILMLIEHCEAAGAQVVSANTDGVTVLCPKERASELQKTIGEWESVAGFQAEQTQYRSLYNSSVNSYVAVKLDGKVKLKGAIADPWSENDLRGQMSKNPQMTILTHAIVALVIKGTPIEETVRACKDARNIVTVTNVRGGAKWRGHLLGRVVRFYWSTDSDPILYVTSGNKVSNSDGARPMIEMAGMPDDVDWDRYVAEAKDLAVDLGITKVEGLL